MASSPRSGPIRWAPILWFGGLTLGLLLLVLATKGASALPPASDKAAAEKEGPPEPKELDLKTDDGLNLKATYYPGTKGEETVPIIILHDLKGERSRYKEIALYLQSKGHAVIVPDLRGHGGSTELHPEGQDKAVTLSAAKIKKADLQLMVDQDVWAVNRYLRDRNNDKELNIEKLCVVGVGMGATVALNWAVVDWNLPVLPTYKQGRYVKALVLVSPKWSLYGATVLPALEHENVKKDLSVLILVGEKDRSYLQSAEKIHGRLTRFHPEPPEKEIRKKKTLFLKKLNTNLQGAKLVNQPEFQINQIIMEFIAARLVDKSFPWEDHKRP